MTHTPLIAQNVFCKCLLDLARTDAVPHVAGNIGSCHHHIATLRGVSLQRIHQPFGINLISVWHCSASDFNLFLLAANQVKSKIAVEAQPVFHCLHACRHKRITCLHHCRPVNTRIVERIAGNHLVLVVAVAAAKTGCIVVFPRQIAAELELRTNVRNIVEIWHSRILFVDESGIAVFTFTGNKRVGCRHAGEIVHHHHCAFRVGRNAEGKHFGVEASAAIVHCHNLVAVYKVVGYLHFVFGIFHHRHLAECAVAHALHHGISLRFGIAALCVGGRLPSEQELARTSRRNGKRVHWQRLHHIVATIALGNKLEHTFVNGAAHRETECRVEAVTHIGKVLMRKQLEQHGWHLGHPRFVVRFVPHAATHPVRFEQSTHIVADVCADGVGEKARIAARRTVGIVVVIRSHIYAQRANDAVVWCGTGIGVERKRQVDRYVQPGSVGQHRRPACKPVDPLGTAAKIVVVVVS